MRCDWAATAAHYLLLHTLRRLSSTFAVSVPLTERLPLPFDWRLENELRKYGAGDTRVRDASEVSSLRLLRCVSPPVNSALAMMDGAFEPGPDLLFRSGRGSLRRDLR